METAQRKKTDPVQLRALADLLRLGYTAEEVQHALGLSRATYYRRLQELEARRAEASRPDDPD